MNPVMSKGSSSALTSQGQLKEHERVHKGPCVRVRRVSVGTEEELEEEHEEYSSCGDSSVLPSSSYMVTQQSKPQPAHPSGVSPITLSAYNGTKSSPGNATRTTAHEEQDTTISQHKILHQYSRASHQSTQQTPDQSNVRPPDTPPSLHPLLQDRINPHSTECESAEACKAPASHPSTLDNISHTSERSEPKVPGVPAAKDKTNHSGAAASSDATQEAAAGGSVSCEETEHHQSEACNNTCELWAEAVAAATLQQHQEQHLKQQTKEQKQKEKQEQKQKSREQARRRRRSKEEKKQQQLKEKQEQKQQKQQEKLQQQLEKKQQKELQKQQKLEEQHQKLQEKQQKVEKQHVKEDQHKKHRKTKSSTEDTTAEHLEHQNDEQFLSNDVEISPELLSTTALSKIQQHHNLQDYQQDEGGLVLPLTVADDSHSSIGLIANRMTPPLPCRAASKMLPPPTGAKTTAFNKNNRNAMRHLSRSTPTMTPSGSPGGVTVPLSAGEASLSSSVATLQSPGGVSAIQPSKATKKLLRRFATLPQDEIVLNSFSCALVSDILLQGTLYITNNYIVFYSKIFGYVSKVVIPCAQVAQIVKERTAKIIPNAVGLQLQDGRNYVFCSLLSRDTAFKLLTRVWKRATGLTESDSEPHYVPHMTGEEDSGSAVSIMGEEEEEGVVEVVGVTYPPTALSKADPPSLALMPPTLATPPDDVTPDIIDGGGGADASSSSSNDDVTVGLKRVGEGEGSREEREDDRRGGGALQYLGEAMFSSLSSSQRPVFVTGACVVLLTVLFVSAACLLHRVHLLSNQLTAAPQEHHSTMGSRSGLYEEVLEMQQRLHSAAATEVERALHLQLKQIATVRESLNALSLIFSSEPPSPSSQDRDSSPSSPPPLEPPS